MYVLSTIEIYVTSVFHIPNGISTFSFETSISVAGSIFFSIRGSWWTWATTNWLSIWEVVLVVEAVENRGFWSSNTSFASEDGGTLIWLSTTIDSFSPTITFGEFLL